MSNNEQELPMLDEDGVEAATPEPETVPLLETVPGDLPPEKPQEDTKEDIIDIPEVKLPRTEAEPNMRVKKVFDVYSVIDETTKSKDKREPLLLLAKPFKFLREGAESEAWTLLTEDMSKDEALQEFMARFFYAGTFSLGQSEIKDRGFFEGWLGDEETPNDSILQQIRDDKNSIAIGARRPDIGKQGGRRLTGKAARAQIGSVLGNGITTSIPLPHTGINMEFSARGDVELLNLDLKMAEERVKIGHDTAGMIFQCSQFGISERLFNFAMESVTDANLLGWDDPSMELAKLIPITDLPVIYWGVAQTLYPNGYPLDLPCASGPLNCKHVERVNLNIQRIFWMNRSKLTTDQQKQLSAVRHKHSLNDLETYAKEAANIREHSFDVIVNGAKMTLELTVPTIHEHIEAGKRWALEAGRAVEDILQTDDPDPMRRLAYMRRVIEMSSLREYVSWVKKITFENGSYVDNKNVEDIEYNLTQLTRGDDEVVDQIFAEIQKFIEKSTVAIIAIPNYACPKCETDQATTVSEEHPELIPLDIEKLFFELKDRRLASRL